MLLRTSARPAVIFISMSCKASSCSLSRCRLKSCTLEKGTLLLVIKHLCVLEDNKTQLLIKEIHDCYRLYGTLGQQNSGSCYSSMCGQDMKIWDLHRILV